MDAPLHAAVPLSTKLACLSFRETVPLLNSVVSLACYPETATAPYTDHTHAIFLTHPLLYASSTHVPFSFHE